MSVLEAPRITAEIIAEHGLSPKEYDRVLHALGREPNLVELGIFSVMWSEHCSYKSSRLHLKKLPTEAPWVICGPGENAGVIDIGDGQAAIFKMESHNHPSYIEPYQGAATGVGGILRDVFTMGARPVANMNALRFGRPVRWLEDRLEHMLTATQERTQVHTVEIGFDDEGRLLALRDRFVHDTGAYTPRGLVVPLLSASMLAGPASAAPADRGSSCRWPARRFDPASPSMVGELSSCSRFSPW